MKIIIVILAVCAMSFGSVAHAAVYFMTDSGAKVSELGVADAGQNKGKIVVVGADGKEITLGGVGSCGTLCAILTAKIENGKAFLAPAVPDVDMGNAAARLKVLFAETFNAREYQIAMGTPELATASVGKMLGVVSAAGTNAVIGLVDTKDERTDVLVTDMEQAKRDIAALKAELAQMKVLLAAKTKETSACRSEVIPVPVTKAVGSGDWVVAPLPPAPPVLKAAPLPVKPVIQI